MGLGMKNNLRESLKPRTDTQCTVACVQFELYILYITVDMMEKVEPCLCFAFAFIKYKNLNILSLSLFHSLMGLNNMR